MRFYCYINLTITSSSSSSQDITSCDSFEWNGEIYTESGTYTYSTLNSLGCDSSATLNLTIINSSSSFEEVEACRNIRMEWRNIY